MEKTLLRRKTVLENGIIMDKVYFTKKIVNYNKNIKLKEGWNIDGGGVCDPACPASTSEYISECVSGNCVKIPLG